MATDAKAHYNHVTDAWKEFMGDNLHFGYFEPLDVELPQATDMMIEKMLELCDITKDSRILDVGCGIGGPAFYIHEKYPCIIDGISTSERGVQLANETSEERGTHDVRFKVADGLDNGFPDKTFDIVWIMEASHLIHDKRKLFRECHRVLKEDGALVLCDLMQKQLLPIHKGLLHFFTHLRQYYRLMKAYGPGQVPTMGNLCDRLIEADFSEVAVIDVSEKTIPTLKWWRENAISFRDNEIRSFSKKDIENFIHGCEYLEGFFLKGLFGYGILRADK
jgi:cyclopropane fatty-acyl-phospholipid synthase-like methyltransferase